MKKLTFPSSSYYTMLFQFVDYKVFEPIRQLLSSHGYNDEIINVFFEYGFISVKIHHKIVFDESIFKAIIEYWRETIGRIESYRFASANHLTVRDEQYLQELYADMSSGKIKGCSLNDLQRVIKLEYMFSVHNLVQPESLPMSKNHTVLYEDSDYGTPFFRSIVSMDMNVLA